MSYRKLPLVIGLLALSLLPLPSTAQENFANAWPVITYYTKARIKVAVVDEREYVRSGKKENTYLGAIRDGYGIPHSIHTSSSMPLADDLEKAISNGFANAGINASIADSGAKTILKSTGTQEKLLVVTLSEWVSDSYRNSVGFTHKTRADVYNFEGNKIATAASENTKTFSSPLEGGREALSELLSNKDIIASLSSKQIESSGKVSPPTDAEKKDLPTKNDSKSRLLALKELLDAGAISNADYEKKKKEILSAM